MIQSRRSFWASFATLGAISAARCAGADDWIPPDGTFCLNAICTVTDQSIGKCTPGGCGGMTLTVPSELDRAEAACNRHAFSEYSTTLPVRSFWSPGWEKCADIYRKYMLARQAERDAEAAAKAKQDAEDLALIEKLTK